MSIIKVENLSKKYQILHQQGKASYNTLTEDLTNFFKKPSQWMRGQKNIKEDIWAIKDINFSVESGEILGIVGPNGAGKSTLLKILSRITPPTTGKAVIKGRISSLLEVGVGFHPELTGKENIYLNGAILGMTKKEITRKFDEIVEFAGIEKFLDTPVKRYSSGMYVRLAFSVAAHLEPEILLIDEVLAVGDAAFQRKSLGKMKDVSKSGRTVLVVSHNMGLIQQLTQRCLLLSSGKIISDDKTTNVVEQYLKSSMSSIVSNAFNTKTEVDGFYVESIKLDEKQFEHGFNKPIKFDICLNADHSIKDLVILMPLNNSMGSTILMLKAVIADLEPGRNIVSLIVEDHHLPPGSYNTDIDMILLRNCIFSRKGVVSFEISDIGIEDWYMSYHKDLLGAYPPVKYFVEKI